MTPSNVNPPEHGAAGARLKGPKSVLVADDEHLIASGIAAALRELGYAVIGPAANGNEAIELSKARRPDLALLDIRMAETDGLSAAEVIFGEFGVPVIVISAYSNPDYVAIGSRIGVFGYLLKPVTQDQLRVAIPVAWSRYTEFASRGSEIQSLKERLEHRKLIEQAKWIIIKRKSIPESEAMKLLQAQARNSRRPLVDVARAVIESENLLGD
jgi:two-component system, response regulator PdtaR